MVFSCADSGAPILRALPNTHLPPQIPAMTDVPALPDHLSADPRSPHHNAAVFEREVAVHFNGKERFDVQEYCVSEGWIKVPAGKAIDRRGQPLLLKLKGTVVVAYRRPEAG